MTPPLRSPAMHAPLIEGMPSASQQTRKTTPLHRGRFRRSPSPFHSGRTTAHVRTIPAASDVGRRRGARRARGSAACARRTLTAEAEGRSRRSGPSHSAGIHPISGAVQAGGAKRGRSATVVRSDGCRHSRHALRGAPAGRVTLSECGEAAPLKRAQKPPHEQDCSSAHHRAPRRIAACTLR